MDKLFFRKILITALSVLAIIYVAYLLLNADFKTYPTENAVQATITNKIYSSGYIIRDETLIKNDTSGVLSYTIENSEQIKAGGEIAKVYANENDAALQSKANTFEAQLTALQALQSSNSTASIGIDTINNNINNNIFTYLKSVNNGDIYSFDKNINNLIYTINQSQIFTGKIQNFNSEIADLQSQIDQLRASSGDSIGSIVSEKAGYFTSNCDGYENVIKVSDIEKLKLSDLKNIKKKSIPENTAGKIVSGLKWYVACEITSDDATSLSLWDGMATVLFSDACTDAVPAKINRIYKDKKEDSALLILECDYMNNDLIEARQEPIEVGLGTYTGLRISKKAVHDDYVKKVTYDDNNKQTVEEKKVQGVYVLYGSEVHFKQISIIYADDDYVLCDPDPKDGILFNGKTVALYDQVILEGNDLYDGKVIE